VGPHRSRSRRVIRGQQMQCPINSGARPPNALVPSFRSFVCFLNNHDSLPVTVREGVQALLSRDHIRVYTLIYGTIRMYARMRMPGIVHQIATALALSSIQIVFELSRTCARARSLPPTLSLFFPLPRHSLSLSLSLSLTPLQLDRCVISGNC
jgi:hypothetical protein